MMVRKVLVVGGAALVLALVSGCSAATEVTEEEFDQVAQGAFSSCSTSAPIDGTIAITGGTGTYNYSDASPWGSTTCQNQTHVAITNTFARTFTATARHVTVGMNETACNNMRISVRTQAYSCVPFPCGWKGWNGEVIYKGVWSCIIGFCACWGTQYLSGPEYTLGFADTWASEVRMSARIWDVNTGNNVSNTLNHQVVVTDTE